MLSNLIKLGYPEELAGVLLRKMRVGQKSVIR